LPQKSDGEEDLVNGESEKLIIRMPVSMDVKSPSPVAPSSAKGEKEEDKKEY
jgi:hypothetical protein